LLAAQTSRCLGLSLTAATVVEGNAAKNKRSRGC
jgi:hypothetical protein